MMKNPFISVVIPVKNGGEKFERCLQGLMSSDYKNYELIVVNDASKDDSPRIAESYGATVLHSSDFPFRHKSDFPFQDSLGPAGARNIGAKHAGGEIIFFIDADVVLRKDSLRRVADFFEENKDYAAVFGSYDDSPDDPSFISQYRNMLHCYIHQISLAEAETFWSGCGAIRKDVFLNMEGFDLKTYRLPSVEDIDLGYRMNDAGYKICLDKKLQAKHLKQWTFKSMLITDIFHRAIPWSQIMWKRKRMPNDLNIQTHHRLSGALVLLIFLLISLIAGGALIKVVYDLLSGGPSDFKLFMRIDALALVLVLILNVLFLNINLYVFFLKRKGLGFTLQCIPLHFFYYLYSITAFMILLVDVHFPPFRALRKKLGFITHV